MSSTNKTSALGLSQWILSDPFRMEDFNADNAKIDAAVARKSEFVKLKEITTTAQATAVEINVQSINFSQFYAIIMQAKLSGTGNAKLIISPANSQDGNVMGNTYGVPNGMCYLYQDGKTNSVFMLPMQDGTKAVSTVMLHGVTFITGQSSGSSFETLSTLTVSAADTSYYISAGSKITLWGVK